MKFFVSPKVKKLKFLGGATPQTGTFMKKWICPCYSQDQILHVCQISWWSVHRFRRESQTNKQILIYIYILAEYPSQDGYFEYQFCIPLKWLVARLRLATQTYLLLKIARLCLATPHIYFWMQARLRLATPHIYYWMQARLRLATPHIYYWMQGFALQLVARLRLAIHIFQNGVCALARAFG